MKTAHRALLCLAALLGTASAWADTIPQIYCAECRSTEHNRDFGNFAFNQVYGPNSWILFDEAIIINPQGDWVYVDLDFVLEENFISNIGQFVGIDLGIPTTKIQIETVTDTVFSDTYLVDLDMVDTTGPLPVPSDCSNGGSDSGDTGDGDGGAIDGGGGDSSGGGSTGGGGVGAGGGDYGGGGTGGGGGMACTSAGGEEWHCVQL